MGRVDGKVAFVTGAARGQGRAHAVRLAQEGADVVVTDLAGPVETVTYTPATPDDLAETVKEVEALGRRVISFEADVRDHDALAAGLDAAVAELGGLDVVVANAGIINAVRPSWELDEADWQTMIDINLSGVWHTTKAGGSAPDRARSRRVAGADQLDGRLCAGSPASRTTTPPSTACWGSRGRSPTSWRRTVSGSTRCTRRTCARS